MSVTIGGLTLELHPSGPRAWAPDHANAWVEAVTDAATNPVVTDADVTAEDTTEARSLATRFAEVANIKDYGAVGDGTTDDYAAIQEAIDSLRTVYVPPGIYKCSRTPRMRTSSQRLYGAGETVSIFKNIEQSHPLLLIGPNYTSPADGASMTAFGDPRAIYFPYNNHNFGFNLSSGGDTNIHGATGFYYRTWYKATDLTESPCLMRSAGRASYGSSNTSAFNIEIVNTGPYPRCTLRTTGGTVTVTSPTAISVGVAYHIEFDWDGSNLYCFVNGVLKASAACTGTLIQGAYEEVTIGPTNTGYEYSLLEGHGPCGYVQMSQFGTTALHTSGFSVPGFHNFDAAFKAGIYVEDARDECQPIWYREDGVVIRRYVPITIHEYAIPITLVEVAGIGFSGGSHGVHARLCDHLKLHHMNADDPSRYGYYIYNNCYFSQWANLSATVSDGGRSSFTSTGPNGASSLRDCVFLGGKVVVYMPSGISTSGIQLSTADGSLRDLWIEGGRGNTGTFSGRGLIMDNEQAPDLEQAVVVEPLSNAHFQGCQFTNYYSDYPAITLDGGRGVGENGFPVTFEGCAVSNTERSGSNAIVSCINANVAWTKGMVHSKNSTWIGDGDIETSTFPGTNALCDVAGVFVVDSLGRFSGVQGLSGSDTPSKNLRGSVTIAAGATTGAVTFAVDEPDASYNIILTAGIGAGAPIATSKSGPWWSSKATGGFTVNLAADPTTGGSSVRVDWMLVR